MPLSREERAASVRAAAHSGALEGKPEMPPEYRRLFEQYVEGHLSSSELVEAVRAQFESGR